MLSIRPGHLENTTGHHHQLRGAPKTPGRQLKSGALRENAHTVQKVLLGGKQTPFHGKSRKFPLPFHHHHHPASASQKFALLTYASGYVLFWDSFVVLCYRTELE